jgi:glutamate-1-semialdehyde aminotransferase
MLAVHRIRADLRALPPVIRTGLAVVGFGGLADVVTHLSFAGPGEPGGHTAAQLSAHAVAFAGMVLVLAGVVVDGARQSRARRRAERTSSGVV